MWLNYFYRFPDSKRLIENVDKFTCQNTRFTGPWILCRRWRKLQIFIHFFLFHSSIRRVVVVLLIAIFHAIQITVRQFKERIQEKTSVEVDLQRLIYCGRVMNDEHPLSGYSMYFHLRLQMQFLNNILLLCMDRCKRKSGAFGSASASRINTACGQRKHSREPTASSHRNGSK